MSGNFDYSREKSYFDGKFNFKGLTSNFGEFGVVNMQFISNDGVLDILSLKTEGLHDAYLSATIVDRGDIQFQIYDQSMFDLSRIEFFRNRHVVGRAKVQGEGSYYKDDIQFSGNFATNQLLVGDLNILKSKAKINLNNKGLMINYMDFYIDRGRLSLSGDIHSHETKLWMTDLKDMEYQLDVEMSKLQIHDLVSVIRQPLDQGASLQAGKRSFNFDSKITALFSKYDFDKLDQFMAHVSDQPNKNIVDKWATVKVLLWCGSCE